MPSDVTIARYRSVQAIARDVLASLATKISADDTEISIARKSKEALHARGITDTWYHDCPALVLLGSRSCLSLSGKDYRPADERVGSKNLVTIDLSPKMEDRWGDCARSFFIEDGNVTGDPITPEFASGKHFLSILHADMLRFVNKKSTFHDLFTWANDRINADGFENLDFLGNVGHSIATRREDREYIERGNAKLLVEVPFFTFEPHVRAIEGKWGFKHENIFYFDRDVILREL